jgi:hypothetical protein
LSRDREFPREPCLEVLSVASSSGAFVQSGFYEVAPKHAILKVGALAWPARLLAGGVLKQGIDLDDIDAPIRELPHAVGPERTRVRSSTVKRARACEARGKGILGGLQIPKAGSASYATVNDPQLAGF